MHGTYTGQLTIAAENDVIINGNLCRTSCSSASGRMLGLIANNFVRIYHPCSNDEPNGSNRRGSTHRTSTIDAAILAIKHSFIVDNYDCGNPLGTLNVEGAIAQKFRGPVGTAAAAARATSRTTTTTTACATWSRPASSNRPAPPG